MTCRPIDRIDLVDRGPRPPDFYSRVKQGFRVVTCIRGSFGAGLWGGGHPGLLVYSVYKQEDSDV